MNPSRPALQSWVTNPVVWHPTARTRSCTLLAGSPRRPWLKPGQSHVCRRKVSMWQDRRLWRNLRSRAGSVRAGSVSQSWLGVLGGATSGRKSRVRHSLVPLPDLYCLMWQALCLWLGTEPCKHSCLQEATASWCLLITWIEFVHSGLQPDTLRMPHWLAVWMKITQHPPHAKASRGLNHVKPKQHSEKNEMPDAFHVPSVLTETTTTHYSVQTTHLLLFMINLVSLKRDT